jgi:hypothetical protein
MNLTWFLPAACRSARLRMVEGIEGRLGLSARLDVEDHVARCGGCADELADLAATRHAVRRAFGPYRSAHPRVAPGRARLAAAAASSRSETVITTLLRVARGPAKHGLAFSVLMFLLLGTVDSAMPAADGTEAASVATRSRLLQIDEEARLVRFWHAPGTRIPVGDSLVIEVTSASEEQPVERAREGLVPFAIN